MRGFFANQAMVGGRSAPRLTRQALRSRPAASVSTGSAPPAPVSVHCTSSSMRTPPSPLPLFTVRKRSAFSKSTWPLYCCAELVGAQDRRHEVHPRLDGEGHARLEVDVHAQVAGAELRAALAARVEHRVAERLQVVHVEPESGAPRRGGKKSAWAPDSTSASARPLQEPHRHQALGNHLRREEVEVAVARAGLHRGDRRLVRLQHHVVHVARLGGEGAAHRPGSG